MDSPNLIVQAKVNLYIKGAVGISTAQRMVESGCVISREFDPSSLSRSEIVVLLADYAFDHYGFDELVDKVGISDLKCIHVQGVYGVDDSSPISTICRIANEQTHKELASA